MIADATFNRRVMRVFEDMLDQSPAVRDDWLDRTCSGEPAIRDAVRAMADASGSSRFLPTSPPEPRRSGGGDVMPARVGQYRVIGELGRGGMGVVYLGERDDGLFEHRAAIKLMRRTLLSERALARFATERRILAMLRHPHIAQMLDGGLTRDGGSYIVMELIAGQPITDHCAARSLDIAARLALFREMGDAIAHAHRNLIVHADIKPSNVIVEDGFGVKLLDFGIARLLDDSDDERHEGYTPGYASPARIEGMPATPADDVFAAGKLLGDLIRDVPGTDADLRAIADKACAPNDAERYGDIGELLADIRRWQAHEPIRAVQSGRAKRALLYWRRHRLAIILAGAVAVLVLATLVATTALWLRAERERASAERRYEVAREMSRYLLDDVAAQIAPLPGGSAIREQIAARAERSLERIGGLAGDEKRMGIDDALAAVEVGEILGTDGREGVDPSAALAAIGRAEAGLPRLILAYPDRFDLRVMLSRALVAHALLVARVHNDPGAADRLLDRASATLDGIPPRGPGPAASRDARWDIAIARAAVIDGQGSNYLESIAVLDAALRHVSVPPRPKAAADALRLNRTFDFLGNAFWYSGEKTKALGLYDEALLALSEPGLQSDVRIVQRTSFEQYQIASTLADLDRMPQALAHIERGLADAERLRSFDATPPVRHTENVMRSEYGAELAQVGRFAEAIDQAKRSVAGAKALVRIEPQSYFAQRAIPVDLRPLAEIYLQARRFGDACATANRGLSIWSALARRGPLASADRQEVGNLHAIVARCQHNDSDPGG